MNKSVVVVISVAVLALLVSCDIGNNSSGSGGIRIEVFDNPPPSNVDHVYLTITEVNVAKSGEDWITLEEPNMTIDFLELINGTREILVDSDLDPGDYTQLRLVLSDSNSIVIEGESYPLKVPSGEQTGVKLNLDFTVEPDEIIEIYIDFDASKSITWTPGNYLLRPVFKAFKKVLSGTVAGMVQDTSDTGISNALVEAVGSSDTIATITDNTGAYKLILLEGVYSLEVSAEGYSGVDTTYSGVDVQAGTDLTGFGFQLQ